MRKIGLDNYKVLVRDQQGRKVDQVFDVREALVDLCFVPAEGCKSLELLKRKRLAEKIDAAVGTVLLEQAEWERLIEALDKTRGLGKIEAELVARIVEAPDVLVGEV